MTSFIQRYVIISGLSIAGYMLSFCSQLIISYYFGTSRALDTYWAVMAIANLLVFYVGPLREALVPAVHRAASRDPAEAGRVLSAGLSLLGIMIAVSSLFLWLFAYNTALPMVSVAGNPGTSNTQLVPWLMAYLCLFGLSETLNGTLTSFDRIVWQTAARVVASATLIVVLVFVGSRSGLVTLVLAQTASLAVSVFMSLGALRSLRIRMQCGFLKRLRESNMYPLFGALLVNYLFSQVYVLAERWAMIHASSGLLSSFQYSTALVNTLLSVVAFPLANMLWPQFLAMLQRGDRSGANELAIRAFVVLTAALLLICTFVSLVADDLVAILFARGAFDERSVHLTVMALRATIFAAVPIGLATLLGRLLISSQEGYLVLWVGLATTSAGLIFITVCVVGGLGDLVIWHWLIANACALIVTIALIAHRGAFKTAPIVAGGSRILLFVVILVFAAWATPELSFGHEIVPRLGRLAARGSIYLGITAGLVWTVGLDRWARAVFRKQDAGPT